MTRAGLIATMRYRSPLRPSVRTLSRRAFVAGLGASAAALALGTAARNQSVAVAAPLAQDVLTPSGRKAGQLAPLITPTAAFYTVTKNAGGDPRIESGAWRLIVDGQVNSPVQLDYAVLQQLPPIELTKTLECISNLTANCELASFGCDLISTATWRGARLIDVFDLAGGLAPGAVGVLATAADEFTSAIPLDAATDPDTLVVYQMNGAPLPPSHGYPARLLVPGRYGLKSAKWIVQLSAVTQLTPDWYGQRNWNRDGIVRTMARIDVPANGAQLPAGPQRIAGVAYAGSRGVAAVEYSADGGATWQPAAFVEPQPDVDTWVRWQGAFDLAPGQLATLVCRATDGTGALQPADFTLPQPDGGAGRHSVTVQGV